MTDTEHLDYSLAQVAALVPCHHRQLRRMMHDKPELVPHFIWDDHSKCYRFPAEGVRDWLETRKAARAALRKPYLKWVPALVARAA